MRVLHLTAGNLFGGIERALLNWLAVERGHSGLRSEVGLCFGGRLAEQLAAGGVVVHKLPEVRFSRPWSVLRARAALRGLLRRDRPDVAVMHACWSHAVFAPVLARAGVACVFFVHDIPAGRHWLERLAGRTRPQRVLTNSDFTRSTVDRLFARVPSETAYLPLPEPRPAGEQAQEQLRSGLGVGGDELVILIAARLERWKGHALLLEALGHLRDRGDLPLWRCWVAGEAQRAHEQVYRQELEDQAARLGIAGRVQWIGLRQDMAEVLAAADVHCQPNSGPEPFGMAFVEALQAGLPVITTDLGGASEILGGRSGGFGLLVEPGSAVKLAEGLAGLLGDAGLRRRLAEAGPGRAAELCGPSVAMPRLEAGLRAAMG